MPYKIRFIYKNGSEISSQGQVYFSHHPVIQFQLKKSENPEQAKQIFYSSLQDILHSTLLIERSHDEIVNRFIKQVTLSVFFRSIITDILVYHVLQNLIKLLSSEG